jgi:cytochrome P450
MLYASGNRDEQVFGADAGRFDVRRATNPMHLAFGFGEHVCLGASLARMESRIFLEELLARFPSYAVTGQPERVLSTTVAGIRSLPVVLAPSAGRC